MKRAYLHIRRKPRDRESKQQWGSLKRDEQRRNGGTEALENCNKQLENITKN